MTKEQRVSYLEVVTKTPKEKQVAKTAKSSWKSAMKSKYGKDWKKQSKIYGFSSN